MFLLRNIVQWVVLTVLGNVIIITRIYYRVVEGEI